MRSVRQSLSASATLTLVSSLVLSRLDYCISSHCGAPAFSLKRLQSVLHAAARLIVGARRYDHISPHIRDLNWLSIEGRIQKRTATLVHRCLHDRAPEYLHDSIHRATSGASRRLRSSNRTLLTVPLVRRPSFGLRSFFVCGQKLWNSLPASIQEADDFYRFTAMLGKYLADLFIHKIVIRP